MLIDTIKGVLYMLYNKYIDHTLLKPDATEEQIRKLCQDALEYDFAYVCVNPGYVHFVTNCLKAAMLKFVQLSVSH